MSQSAVKRIKKYLRMVGAPKWREKADWDNYKKLDWRKRTIINQELKDSL